MSEYELKGKRVYVAGHRGMVGSAIVRRLESENCEVVTTDRRVDLRNQAAVSEAMNYMRPDAVVTIRAFWPDSAACWARTRSVAPPIPSLPPVSMIFISPPSNRFVT